MGSLGLGCNYYIHLINQKEMRKAGLQCQIEKVEHLGLSWDKRESFGNAVGGNPSAGIVYAPTKRKMRKKKACKGRKTPKARVIADKTTMYFPDGEIVIYRHVSFKEAEWKFPTAIRVEHTTKRGTVLMSQAIGLGRIAV